MKTDNTWLPVLLALAASAQMAVAGLAPLAPFPDEKSAMQALERRDTPAARAALAKIRFTHAGELMDASVKGDPGKLIWALDYAQSATELAPTNAAYWFFLGYLYGQAPRHPETGRHSAGSASKVAWLRATRRFRRASRRR